MDDVEQAAFAFLRMKAIMERKSGTTFTIEEAAERIEGIILAWPNVIRVAVLFDRWVRAPSDTAAEEGLFRHLYDRFQPFVHAARTWMSMQPKPDAVGDADPAPNGARVCDAQHEGHSCHREHGHDGLHDSDGWAWGEAGVFPPAPMQAQWVSDFGPRLQPILNDMEKAGISVIAKVYLDPGRFTTVIINEDRSDVFAEVGLLRPALFDGWVPVPPEYVISGSDDPETEPSIAHMRKPVTTGEA